METMEATLSLARCKVENGGFRPGPHLIQAVDATGQAREWVFFLGGALDGWLHMARTVVREI